MCLEHVHDENGREEHSREQEHRCEDHVIHFVQCGVGLLENFEAVPQYQERV